MFNKQGVIEKIYKDAAFKNVCRNIATPELYEDLYHEVIINLLELPEEKIKDAHEKKYLKFLFVKIAHNSWNSKHSPFYRKYRHNDTNESLESLSGIDANEDIELEQRELNYHNFTTDIKSQIESLDWYEGTLVKLYIDIGDCMKISKMTGIKYGAVNYTIKKTIKKIKLDNHDKFREFSDNFNS